MAEQFDLTELPDEQQEIGSPLSHQSLHSDNESNKEDDVFDDNNDETASDAEDKTQGRKKSYFYTVKDDINIAIKCLDKKQFGKASTKELWSSIAEELNLPVTWEGIKRRFIGKMKKFKQNNYKSKRGSGISEDYTRNYKLLTELDSLITDELAKKDAATLTERKKRLQQKAAGEGIRLEAVKRMKSCDAKEMAESDDESLDSPIRETGGSKRRKTDEILTLMRQKDDSLTKHRKAKLELQKQDVEMRLSEHQSLLDERKKRLELDERRLALEEKQHEFAIIRHSDEIELKRLRQANEHEIKLRQQQMDESEKNMLLTAIKNSNKST